MKKQPPFEELPSVKIPFAMGVANRDSNGKEFDKPKVYIECYNRAVFDAHTARAIASRLEYFADVAENKPRLVNNE